MPKRNLPTVTTRELSAYEKNPYQIHGSPGAFYGLNGEAIIQPSDDLLMRKGGAEAIILYREILYDGTVQSAFRKLVQEITSRPLRVTPFSEKPGDVFISEFVEGVLNGLPMDDIYTGLAESLITGVAYGEVLWKKSKKGIVPYDVRIRDQRQFLFTKIEKTTDYSLRVRNDLMTQIGELAPQRKFIVSRYHTTHTSDPYGSGLGRILFSLVKFSRRALENYLLFTDRFAMPTAVGEAPPTATVDEVDEFFDHISNLSTEMAVVLPPGFSLDFANPTGNPQAFIDLVNHIEKVVNILIIAENEVGQVEAGSRASSETANSVRVTRSQELAQRISWDLQKTLVRWIVDLNFGEDVEAPTLERTFDILASNLGINDLVQLKEKFGLVPPTSWIEKQFSVTLEDESESSESGSEKKFTSKPGEDLSGILG